MYLVYVMIFPSFLNFETALFGADWPSSPQCSYLIVLMLGLTVWAMSPVLHLLLY